MWSLRNLLLLSFLALAACGFEPVYGTRSHDAPTAARMAAIEVIAPKGRLGALLKAEVEDSLNPTARATAPDYELVLGLESNTQAFVIEQDGTASRYNITYSAPYRLTRIADGMLINQGRVRRSVSYNVSETDDYATYTAQTDANERAVIELADDVKMRISAALAQMP